MYYYFTTFSFYFYFSHVACITNPLSAFISESFCLTFTPLSENRIQLSRENIAAANITEANANAQKAVELWNQEMLNTKYLDETQEERVAKLVSEIALLQKEGAVQDSIVDVNYNTARKIQKEVENFYYDMITKRMSAEAAKEQAAAMVDKIAKDYELGKGHLDNQNHCRSK